MFYADFVRETSTAPGTATFNLNGPPTDSVGYTYQGFVAAGAAGKTVPYAAFGADGWEVGTGTVTDAATDTLTRTVAASSNANAAVNFTGAVTIDLTFSAPAAQKTSFPKRAVISDHKATGTQGGGFASGAWQTRDLNTEDEDPDGIVTLSANQFTLGAGTYLILARAPGVAVEVHKARIQNVTDATTALLGSNGYTSYSNLCSNDSFVTGTIQIAATKTFELQHRCQSTKTTNGFGVAGNLGVDEIYATLEIKQLA